ncbi:MAG: group 1 truncated hemoglobin [Pseudomonadota bacterium]
MSDSLFQKYGGFAVVSRVVLSFYDKVMDSDQIGDYFEDIDLKKVVDHQTKFMSSLLGGPASYSNEHLKVIHAPLGISDPDMDEMIELLAETLDEFGFEAADRNAVLSEIEARRSCIVDRDAG